MGNQNQGYTDEPPGAETPAAFSLQTSAGNLRAPEAEAPIQRSTSKFSEGRSNRGDGGQAPGREANSAGVELIKESRYEEAVKKFKEALRYEERSVQILNNIGLAYAKMQDFNAAYEWYEKAYNQDKSDVETVFSLAWVERKRQRYPHAKELFMKVLELKADHEKALYLLGDILKNSNDHEGAARHFERYLRCLEQQRGAGGSSSSIDGHIALAQCYENLRQYDKAVGVYSKVLNMDPSRIDVTFFLGRGYYYLEQYKLCLQQFDRIPDDDPKMAFEARTFSAKASRELEDHPTAIQYAEGAAQFRKHPEVMHFIGEEWLQLNNQQKAAQWFRQALEIDPSHPKSLMDLGQLMYKQQHYHEAEVHLAKAASLDRPSASATGCLALVKYKLKKVTECRQWCDAALRLDPLSADALWLLAEMNKSDAGEETWYLSLRYPAEVTVVDVCQTIAKGYLSRSMKPEGLVWLKKILQRAPSDPRAKEAIQVLSKHDANAQDALDVLEQRRQPLSSGAVPSAAPAVGAPSAPTSAFMNSSSAQSSSTEELERFLRRAERASMQSGGAVDQWNEVMTHARFVLRSQPKDALALKCVARALLSTGGDVGEIKEYARRATECSDDKANFNLGYDLSTYLAEANERGGDLKSAERYFEAALLSKPGDKTAMLGLARSFMQRSEIMKARQFYEQVAKAHPDCADAHKGLAEIFLKAGENAEAYKYASKAAQLNPSDSGTLICFGIVCSKVQRNDEAIRALERGLVLPGGTNDAAAMQVLADLQRRAGRSQEAIKWYKHVLEHHRPGDYECSYNLAQLHKDRGAAGASQAIHYFRIALQRIPNGNTKEAVMLYKQMTEVQCSINAWQDAQQTLEKATREHPDVLEFWQQLQRVYVQLQDKAGEEKCQKRLAQSSGRSQQLSNSSSSIAYGDKLLADGMVRQAIEHFEKALRDEPANVQVQLKLATSYRADSGNDKHLGEAAKLFDEVLNSNPNNAEALDGAAYCHRKLQDYDTAVQLYQLILKASPQTGNELPLYYLGDILYKQHRHAECQHYLMRLVDSGSSSDFMKSALYTLAKSHVSLDEYEKTEQYCLKGLEKWETHPHFLFILALVKNRTAHYDESIRILEKALKHIDSCEEARNGVYSLEIDIRDYLAQAYERKKDYETANKHLDLALQKDPNHISSIITRGLVQMNQNKKREAEDSFKKALTIEKHHALALVRLGYCKLSKDDSQFLEANQLFQLALQQRCGTVSLPQSIKGTARVYLALSFMAQKESQQALFHLAEAKKNHKNFREVCAVAREAIVNSNKDMNTDVLVDRLQLICDLDINKAQSWTIVQLLAKELEFETTSDDKACEGPRIQPRAGASTGNSRGGYNPISSLPTGQNVPATSSSAAPGQQQEQRKWAAPAEEAGRRWEAPQQEGQRQWTKPAEQPAPKPQPVPGSKHQILDIRDTIDISLLEWDPAKDCLGTGGFGAVYRGYYRHDGKKEEVAIKKLFAEAAGPAEVADLEKEVNALKNLDHPRLVKFIGACLQAPNLCIVTEYMAGGSLYNLLHKENKKLQPHESRKMAEQVTDGVAFLHGRRPPVVHRDMKSMNIVLDRIKNAKICDFGLTQSMDKTHISCKDGSWGGSPRYTAPEMYDSKNQINEKVDIWALGCVLVEIFGGPLPYSDCQNVMQIVAKIQLAKECPEIPSSLPIEVQKILQGCLLFEPPERSRAEDCLAALRRLN